MYRRNHAKFEIKYGKFVKLVRLGITKATHRLVQCTHTKELLPRRDLNSSESSTTHYRSHSFQENPKKALAYKISFQQELKQLRYHFSVGFSNELENFVDFGRKIRSEGSSYVSRNLVNKQNCMIWNLQNCMCQVFFLLYFLAGFERRIKLKIT